MFTDLETEQWVLFWGFAVVVFALGFVAGQQR